MRIMILSTRHTGMGHNSIASAICDSLVDAGCECRIVDMVDISGGMVGNHCKSYGKVTNNVPVLWWLAYNVSHMLPNMVNQVVQRSCKKNFEKEFLDFSPDCVVSVHPMFVGSVVGIVKSIQPHCQFVTVLADLVSIHHLWIDKRVDLTICPTQESLDIVVKRGIPQDRCRVVQLAIRKQIVQKALAIQPIANHSDNHNNRAAHHYTRGVGFYSTNKWVVDKDYSTNHADELHCMIMSGGEGSGEIIGYANDILKLDYVHLSIICGKNDRLKNKCEKLYKQEKKVTVYGFVDDIADLIAKQDLAIVRGSPNVIMECVHLLVPMIVVSTLPGQENGNDDFVINNGLGIVCQNNHWIGNCIAGLYKNHKEKLIQIRNRQLEYRDLYASQKIANQVIDIVSILHQ